VGALVLGPGALVTGLDFKLKDLVTYAPGNGAALH